jgi:hypothetical protein
VDLAFLFTDWLDCFSEIHAVLAYTVHSHMHVCTHTTCTHTHTHTHPTYIVLNLGYWILLLKEVQLWVCPLKLEWHFLSFFH